MSLKKLIVFFAIVFIINSCKQNKEHSDVSVIDISQSFNNVQKLKISSIANKIDYIQLQNDSTLIIDEINNHSENILFSEDKIIIKDKSDEVFLFDKSGAFINKIGAKGRGPGEYTRIQNIAKLDNYDIVVVYSAELRKVLCYNYKGEFIKEINIDFWPIGLISNGEDLIFINTLGTRESSDYYSMSVVSLKGEIKKRLLEKPKEKELSKKINFGLSGFKGNGYYINNDFHYFENSSYGDKLIWEIGENYDLNPKYIIDTGEMGTMPLELQTEENLMDINARIKYNEFENLFETTDYIFARIYYAEDERLNHILYNKNSKKSTSVRFDKKFGAGFNFAFENDIDGGLPFWPRGKVSDNKMFMLVYGYEIKDYLAQRGDNYDAIDAKARDRLLKLVENSKVSDNPILMIVTLKE